MSATLDAINFMLAGIGEAPVSSLVSGVPEAADAARFLDQTTREILLIGWLCNVDDAVVQTPDVSGFIWVPESVLQLTTSGRDRWRRVAVRTDPTDDKRKLWDAMAGTFVWTQPVTCRVVHLLPFKDLTEGLQRYVREEAALRFQADKLGSQSLDVRRKERAGMALAALQDEEAATDRVNTLTSSQHCAWITQRNFGLWGT